MPHGTRHEQTPGKALEDAAANLRGVLGAIRESAAGRLPLLRDGEAQALRDFARSRDLILDPFEFLAPAKPGGEEHLILRDDANERVIKLTKPNCFGLTVAAEWFLDDDRDEAEIKPAMRGATPLEYLERLLLQNEVFGDTIELLGIVDKRQALHVVTSQPTIIGGAVSTEAITVFMQGLGFRLLPDIHVGRLGAVSFLRDRDGIAAFDCHSANFLGADGDVFPIDVLLVRADEELLAALASIG